MRGLVLLGLAATASACGPDASGSGCKDKLIAGDLVITEVFADAKAPPGGSGTDEGKEWFEIYNASDRPIELKGMTITHSRPDGVDKAKSHTMDDTTIAPGQFLTLGNSTQDLLAPYIDYGYSSDLGDFFNTDGGKIVLKCGDSEIDGATYEAVKEGRSRQLTNAQPPDYTLNDDPNMWCQANDGEFETGNFGTPGSDNDCSPVVIGQCSDNGTMRDTVPPMPGDLVITEVMPKPKSPLTAMSQWFEVLAKADVDLNGVGLDRANDTNVAPTLINSTSCVHVAAGSYVLFARSTDPQVNGNLTPTPLAVFTFTLAPTTVTPDVQLVYGSTVIDAVTWTSAGATSGKSLSLDPDSLTAAGNDSPTNFCDGVANYEATGPNQGTPGIANPQCATVAPPGMCDMGGGSYRPIVPPLDNALVITEFLANPAATPSMPPDGTTDADKEWFEIFNTSGAAFDLNELGLKTGSATTTPAPIQASTCISVAPSAYALIARSADMAKNGGMANVDATFNFGLTDSGTTSTGIQVFRGTTMIDAISWTGVSSGKALQLDPDKFNTTDNNTAAVTPMVYCLATTPYGDGSNLGSPKAPGNAQCP